ncbi:MAG: hypothetical protein MAG795_00352 [Candidatus Woesearchaeota archaeon]|nr:hypothetical protein [Candidatus Woesearchaeota archaeon]
MTKIRNPNSLFYKGITLLTTIALAGCNFVAGKRQEIFPPVETGAVASYQAKETGEAGLTQTVEEAYTSTPTETSTSTPTFTPTFTPTPTKTPTVCPVNPILENVVMIAYRSNEESDKLVMDYIEREISGDHYKVNPLELIQGGMEVHGGDSFKINPAKGTDISVLLVFGKDYADLVNDIELDVRVVNEPNQRTLFWDRYDFNVDDLDRIVVDGNLVGIQITDEHCEEDYCFLEDVSDHIWPWVEVQFWASIDYTTLGCCGEPRDLTYFATTRQAWTAGEVIPTEETEEELDPTANEEEPSDNPGPVNTPEETLYPSQPPPKPTGTPSAHKGSSEGQGNDGDTSGP